jgi:hypothetical protein
LRINNTVHPNGHTKTDGLGRAERTSEKLVRPLEKDRQEQNTKIGSPVAAQGTTRPKTT